MNRRVTVLFVSLVLLSVVQALWQHSHLPETVASHFDAAGKANGWTSRGTQTALHLFTVLFMAGMFEGIARINRLIPDEFINIPHREHWLAPERRADTFARLTNMARLLGSVLLLFFMGLFHQVYRINTGGGEITLAIAGMSAALFLAMLVIIAASLLRFSRRPS